MANSVTLSGNLGHDAKSELKMVGQSNRLLVTFSLATNETYLDHAGDRQSRTDWHQVTLWLKEGSSMPSLLKKGTSISIFNAKLRSKEYVKDGQKVTRSYVEVHLPFSEVEIHT